MGSCRLALAAEGFRLWVACGRGVVLGMVCGGTWEWVMDVWVWVLVGHEVVASDLCGGRLQWWV